MQESMGLIDQVFFNHYQSHIKIDADLVKRESGHFSQVSSDYQGRIFYELLQNAFDRAENKIIVKIIGDSLFVSNDGERFTYNANHDYVNGDFKGEKFIRYDFQSLCSISTSNKTVSGSIGNKGVGFKSVYALNEYVNIHTKGIVNPDGENERVNISFCLYEVFDDPDTIPVNFNEEIKLYLNKTIKAVKGEFPQRGVPGYYFPLMLNGENDAVFDDFDADIVTIIEVPFKSKEEVNKLLDEIRKIHFEFVGLKYDKNIEIEFDIEEEPFKKSILTSDNSVFFSGLRGDKVMSSAEKAGIVINELAVAIKIKDDDKETGLFYNYLPTKKNSPFKYVDFHADFHTTVDRKDINFDGEKIGAYNRDLHEACIELLFLAINKSLPIHLQVKLNLEYIDSSFKGITEFNWQMLEINDRSPNVYSSVRRILFISDGNYNNASTLLANLAFQFFEVDRKRKDYEDFIKSISEFTNYFSRDYGSLKKWPSEFKKNLGAKLREKEVQFLPEVSLTQQKEILYRKSQDIKISLPSSINLTVTDFAISDIPLKEGLGIKDFSDSNEILKHFRQCSFTGDLSEGIVTEEEQKEILKSCYTLFKSKRESNYLSSHRYAKIFVNEDRDKYTVPNQANFSVSTLFLKLVNGTYKPAQLCTKAELDEEFLKFCDPSDLDNWLRYLGVSTETDFSFVDRRIYDKLKDGLNKLPKLLINPSQKPTIKAELLTYINVASSTAELIHPAIINNNNYIFLKNISVRKLKPELDNLLNKNYDNFPLQYLDILRGVLDKYLTSDRRSILQFYQRVFEVYAKQNWYLIMENNKLHWINVEDSAKLLTFHILGNKVDFDLCTRRFSSKPILAYYLGRSDLYKEKVIIPTKGDITRVNEGLNSGLKDKVSEKLPFILINLSHSNNTESNYLSEDASLSALQERFEKTSIYECDTLNQALDFGELGMDISPKAYAYNDTDLFFSKAATKSQLTQGICDYLFRNISIRDQIELIVFHKELEELRRETDLIELEVINRKWKPDYQEKFNKYQTQILSLYNQELENNESWYKYNEEFKSQFLINLQNENKLSELVRYITKLKNEYEGYFDSFQLEIDYSHVNTDIAIIQEFCNSTGVCKELEERLVKLINKGEKKTLGIEDEIDELKKDFPKIFEVKANEETLKRKREELQNIQDIEEIYSKVKLGNIKEVKSMRLDASNQASHILEMNHKQVIFQGGSDILERNMQLEITGASGEVEVLICLIDEFLRLPVKEQVLGIEAIRIEMRKYLQTSNDSFDKYADACKSLVGNNEELSKALIPFFYVTKEFKYSHFDLIAYRDGKPTLIEVKTTNNVNTKHFYLSISEVNTARDNLDYEIVRVTPKSIVFMGNPIKEIDEAIFEIETNGFKLKPRNYEFTIN